VTTTSYPLLVF